ncbi:MAG TPA: anthranilate/aminodeoxychorismate synthase component II, partial [Gemmatimonadales bacterium]|nr:anthranilate/aminodeoxychorismate synthase component II [Gemmatimonadales bacterium]
MTPRVLLLDNRDSFVWNLARYVRELGAYAKVVRSDATTVAEVEREGATHLIVSPGPCTPAEAGVSVDVIRELG